jgi:energy-coupling factor transporter ATP-binding protein EcfA2
LSLCGEAAVDQQTVAGHERRLAGSENLMVHDPQREIPFRHGDLTRKVKRSLFEAGGGLDHRAGFCGIGVCEQAAFDRFAASLRIRVSDPEEPVRNLSGGNQQKVILAKWLERNGEAIIFDEPTRGIDVGAKYDIYKLINELAAQGKAILLISSELPEVLGLSDRILVMHEGRVTGEIDDVANATQEDA